uniref:Inactive heme oxygenase 2, chloroplastic n=1 Tax=Nelumbo nucifera TaxID=4432 RepID=A0A822Z9G9_NELNU|nr:TPA_asm: hypothetical protein HUJ06_015536 [Nelumbo nucifera]
MLFSASPATATTLSAVTGVCFRNSSSRFVSFPYEAGLQFQETIAKNPRSRNGNGFLVFCCSNFSINSTSTATTTTATPAPILRKRKRYRKQYPGESKGIVEEMRFVAMKLRNDDAKKKNSSNGNDDDTNCDEDSSSESSPDDRGDTWQPSMEGFLKYLVDSKLVFQTLDRIVDESDHVAYAHFRKTGLERTEGLLKDLEWFSHQDIAIPQPGTPGVSYAKYLEELAEKSAPLFLCHFYNIYFAHIAGGQVITKQVSEKLLEGRELKFFRWEGDAQELLKGVRDKLNKLGEVKALDSYVDLTYHNH